MNTEKTNEINIKSNKPAIKIFPNNIEAEKSLLCCILIDGNAQSDIISSLREDHFYSDRNKKIFRAIKALCNQSAAIDIITVNDYIEHSKESDIEFLGYLAEIAGYLPSGINYTEYYNILTRDMLLREIISACNKTVEEAYYSTEPLKLINKATQALFSIAELEQRGGLTHISKSLNLLFERIQLLMRNKDGLRGLPTGYPVLDKTTNGLQNGDLIILAARPSVGKTSFALNIVANIATYQNNTLSAPSDKTVVDNKVIAVFSLEMPGIQLAQRLICAVGEYDMYDISSGSIQSSKIGGMWETFIKFHDSNVYIDDSSVQTPGEIMSKCQKLRSQEGTIDLVVIDYLQLMEMDHEKKNRGDYNKVNAVADISRMLKVLARDLNCPVIVLSQMSRGIEMRGEKDKAPPTPKLSDLRDSGAIEQDADIVLFLTRENDEDKSKKNFNIILTIAKHRNGELKEINYDWQGQYVRFKEIGVVNREYMTLPKKRTPSEDE
ncbi:MAG: replicative DNA helicase [Christensenellaceae bacterium]|nr:replicative DNA helicase [Christensenellaceae bacterium]